MTKYAFALESPLSIPDAVERVTEALAAEGFGVLTRIDAHEVLARKLGHVRRPYVILGACNPNLAKVALESEPDAGLLLPCNVVVRESEEGATTIAFLDPVALMTMAGNPALSEVATEARDRLRRVAATLDRTR